MEASLSSQIPLIVLRLRRELAHKTGDLYDHKTDAVDIRDGFAISQTMWMVQVRTGCVCT